MAHGARRPQRRPRPRRKSGRPIGRTHCMQARPTVRPRPFQTRRLERVLVGVASPADRELTLALLETDIAVKSVSGPEHLVSVVAEFAPDVVLTTPSFVQSDDARAMAALSELRVAVRVPVFAALGEHELESPELLSAVDDFLLRPLRLSELEIRLRQYTTRRAIVEGDDLLSAGDLLLDPIRYRVMQAGREVALTYTEFRLLKLLMQHQGKVITRDAIMRQVWESDYTAGMRTVDVVVRRLRSKLETGATRTVIRTVRNVGYMLIESSPRPRPPLLPA